MTLIMYDVAYFKIVTDDGMTCRMSAASAIRSFGREQVAAAISGGPAGARVAFVARNTSAPYRWQ
jgi:predicted transposase YbfD/YdcC